MADRVGKHLGKYRLLRLLGRGGFAEVYLGEHLQLHMQAAVKVLDTNLESGDLEDFLREARTIAQLKHPHIVRVLDFGAEEDTPFLILDYAPNGSLRQRHPKGMQLPLELITRYTRQIADALQHAHEQRVIHRDIKPENMLLGAQGEALLGDFGIATIAHSSRSQQTEVVAGTVSYMAPEQLQGKPRPASDQYALGVVVYEWLTGRRPFQGSFSEVASQHLFALPPPPRQQLPTLAPAIEEVVLTALAKDPKERYPGVAAFAAALEQASQRQPFLFAPMMVSQSEPETRSTQTRARAEEGSLLFASMQPALFTPAQAVPNVAHQPPEAPTALEARGAPALTSETPTKPAPRPRRPRRRSPIVLATSGLLVIVALALLLAMQPQRQANTINHAPTGTASSGPTSTALANAAKATATAAAIQPYQAQVPGPCDQSSAIFWTANENYQCLSTSLLLSLQDQNGAGAWVYFLGVNNVLPLNYTLQIDIGNMQGEGCASVEPLFQRGSYPESLTLSLCSNGDLSITQVDSSGVNTLYSGSVALTTTYTITLTCKEPSCRFSVNGTPIPPTPYNQIYAVGSIDLGVWYNPQLPGGDLSAEFSHFSLTPLP